MKDVRCDSRHTPSRQDCMNHGGFYAAKPAISIGLAKGMTTNTILGHPFLRTMQVHIDS
jgi:hypothetical protein